ncbi:MAG: hypothetical protein ITD32_02830 [Candidatus Nitrotoga sp.]|nr:hypothetical protein [Candidatus Nitrotoga sp.]MBP0117098.1 hypothetical protein [Candidatus Nitrotoga sp.]MBP0122754.1 hypothetical protein [Candidatus Nitrotoga sp.]MBP0125441.1 hypothetical protein [Candidatus Nitrotoga sp.]
MTVSSSCHGFFGSSLDEQLTRPMMLSDVNTEDHTPARLEVDGWIDWSIEYSAYFYALEMVKLNSMERWQSGRMR